MNKRTIIFRADGDSAIGMGHFTRTLALAEMLNKHFYCIYAIRKPTQHQISEIKKVCHEQIDLQENNLHFKTFLKYLKGNEIVVLDNYYFSTEYQKSIKTKGCKLVCIDDIHNKHFVADIIINHAEGINPDVYSAENYTKFLLGYKFALLRKEFRKTKIKKTEKKYACLIMMGGADPLGITTLLVELLVQIELNRPVAVITGLNDKQKKITTISNEFIYFKNLTAREIANLMNASEFGIFPASTVAIEACALRLPFICGYFMDNQKYIYEGIRENKMALCIDDLSKLTKEKMTEALKQIKMKSIIDSIISNQMEKIDSNIAQRYIGEFVKL